MTKQAAGFLRRNNIEASNVLYMVREEGKTVVVLTDGNRKETYIPLKALVEEFPENVFQLVNKGVALNSRCIVHISGRSFTMSDGAVFDGRLRGNILTSPQSVVAPHPVHERRGVSSRFSVMDGMPLGFIVLALREDDLESKNLVICYCNKAMAVLLGTEVGAVMGRSFNEVVNESGSRWLAICAEMVNNGKDSSSLFDILADMARNGGSRTIACRSGRSDRRVTIYCAQPQPNYCACAFCVS